jgi:hypothetical protein
VFHDDTEKGRKHTKCHRSLTFPSATELGRDRAYLKAKTCYQFEREQKADLSIFVCRCPKINVFLVSCRRFLGASMIISKTTCVNLSRTLKRF